MLQRWFRRPLRVLVVCTANVTRSPYIASRLKQTLKEVNAFQPRRIQVRSAGIHAISGNGADRVVAVLARDKGCPLSTHLASRLTAAKIRRADLILCMDRQQRMAILKMAPEAADRIFRIREYPAHAGDTPDLDIADPTGKEAECYRHFMTMADQEVERISRHLLAHAFAPDGS